MPILEITPPAAEPLSLADLRAAVGIDWTDDDGLLTSIAKAARRWVELYTRRQIVTATYDLYLSDWPDSDVIRIPRPPMSSVTSIKYDDADNAEQTLAATVYDTDTVSEPGRVFLKKDQSWPSLYGAPDDMEIRVRFVCGYGAAQQSTELIPDDFLHAIRIVTRDLYENQSMHTDMKLYGNEAAKALLWGLRFLGDTDG